MFKYKLLILYILFLSGCATVPQLKPPITPQIPGIYHRVERGQTLWRISKIYNVDLEEIVSINRISDAASIEVGQLIFIPRRNKPQYSPYKSPSQDDFTWPVKGRVITSFGQTYNNMINKGINIQPQKIRDVLAAASGRVVFYTDNFEGFGKTIIIDHNNGFMTVYAKNSEVFVKAGDFVQKGTPVAKVNNYLHFQIRKGHIPQNPYFYLAP